MRRLLLAALMVIVQLANAPSVSAQTADVSPSLSAPLTLAIQLGGSKLDPESIRRAVELELGRPVALVSQGSLPQLLIAIRAHRTVTVTYRANNGETRARTIGLAREPEQSLEAIALLSGNLSRDEAAELLSSLLKAKAEASVAAETAARAAEPQRESPPPSAKAGIPKPVAANARPPAAPPASAEPRALQKTFFNLSLLAPLTLFPNTERRSLNLELGLFRSHVGEIRGAGMNALLLHTEGDVFGVSLAPIYNRTDGRLQGLGGSAVIQQNHGFVGVQLSGVLSLNAGPAEGVSAAGALNLGEDLVGVQLAGAMNRARRLTGVQAAGVLNIAEQVSGVQIGVVNVAGDVSGVQIGVVNVAKHVRGTSVGLISVADNGRVQPVMFASTRVPFNLAAKFTIGPIYTQAGFGYIPGDALWQYELGLGAHLALGPWFIEPGIHYSEARDVHHVFASEVIEFGHYRLAAGLDLGRFSPFLGGGLRQRFAHRSDAPTSNALDVEAFAGVAGF